MSANRFINDNIGETLLIPLYMKCHETKKENPIFNDVKACELVNKIDYDFSKFEKDIKSSVGVAIRSNYFDYQVIKFINENKNPIVVTLGCGLDTQYYRIGETASKAIFYELDIPEVIGIREKLLPPHENENYISASMLDTDWMNKLVEKHPEGNFIFVIEGVLMYFDEKDLKQFFWNLAERFGKSELYFDIVNKWLSEHSHLHSTVKLMNAKFKFGTNNDRIFETWHPQLKYQSTKLYYEFKEWKRTGFFLNAICRFIPRFKTAGKMIHYRIN